MHSQSLSDVAAAQIRKHRERLRISREELAEECAKLGFPDLTAPAITNIETGRKNPRTAKRRREVTLDELVVFAHVLAVPPLLLMLPLGEVDEVPVPPGPQGRHPHAVWNWAIGEEPPGVIGQDGLVYADFSRIHEGGPSRLEAWRAARYPAVLYNDLWVAQQALQSAEGRLHSAREFADEDSARVREAKQERHDRLAALAQVLDQMAAVGMRPPAYGREWVDDMQRFGLLRRPDSLRTLEPEGAES